VHAASSVAPLYARPNIDRAVSDVTSSGVGSNNRPATKNDGHDVGSLRARSRPSRGAGRTAATGLPEILEAAMALIRAEGLAALTMRRLADKLGVWTRTLYHDVGPTRTGS
jgi:hypothetical protein